MTNTLTINEFFKRFPDDSACLEHLMRLRFGNAIECPKCKKTGKFHRIARHPAYECAWCGFEIFPMVGTIFNKTHTPLAKWFYAIYLFTTPRHGVPAKELERQLGVSYPTAFRMAHLIRDYMADVDGDDALKGHVEADETYVGGRNTGHGKARRYENKSIVFGIVERGGKVMTKVISNTSRRTLERLIRANVVSRSTISTDEAGGYRGLGRFTYKHGSVNHSIEQWVDGIHHTNTIEGFWSQIKRSIRGTHVHVSRKYLAKYLGEFEYRYNMRKVPWLMFNRLISAF
jgi:transposase-like protein